MKKNSKDYQPASLKDALYQTIHRHPHKSVEAIAEEIGMSASYLYRAALPDQEITGHDSSGVRFPLKNLVPLIRATGDYRALDYIERSLGRVAIELPTAPGAAIAEIARQAVRAATEFGQVMQAVDLTIDDGKVTAQELLEVERECYEAIQAIMALVQATRMAAQ